MSLKDFNGETFVAFVDISGFKDKVKLSTEDAMSTLSDFYNIGYDLLSDTEKYKDVSGIFVSDCAILYVHNQELSEQNKCKKILDIVKEINKECIQKKIMLTTNIAYGHFEYNKKIELPNMQKGTFAGNAYLNAYLDSTKKMKICHCRILKKRFVDNVTVNNDATRNNSTIDSIINSIRNNYVISEKKGAYYFWWQCGNEGEVDVYEEKFKEIENRKFKDICNLTKEYSNATE